MKRNNEELNSLVDRTAEGIRREAIADSIVDDAANRVWARLANGGKQVAQNATSGVALRVVDNNVVASSGALDANHTPIAGCSGYQSLIPAYLNRELSDARRLLLEDHMGECVPCRRALKHEQAESDKKRFAVGASASGARNFKSQTEARNSTRRNFAFNFAATLGEWRVAAAVLISFGLIGLFVWQPFGGGNVSGTVQAADGILYRVADEQSRALTGGASIAANDRIRTARDAHAIMRLADGTLLEMRERSEFSLGERRNSTTINVERGDFIVQMPADSTKPLYVAADDSLITANKATLSVASGTKGTRFSVISGEATVDAGGTSKTLRAGEQFTTRANLDTLSPAEDVKWSREAKRYSQQLSTLHAAHADINNRAARPDMRHSTRLLDLAPADTAFYVALPNWSRTLVDARAILQQRMNENAALRDWWSQRQRSEKGSGDLDKVLDRVGAWGEHLKDEIVVAAAAHNASGAPERVVLLSEVKDPVLFREFLTAQIADLNNKTATNEKNNSTTPEANTPEANKTAARIRIVNDPSELNLDAASANEIFVLLYNDLVAVSPQPALLREVSLRFNFNSASSGAGAPASFVGTGLHERLAALYREGTSLIVAVDLERVLADSHNRTSTQTQSHDLARHERERTALRHTGFDDARHFIVESKDARDSTINRAVLSFKGERRGIAAWLAAPAAMGSLNFISHEASMAAAFVVKEPTIVVGDLFEMVKTTDPALWQSVVDAQAANGVDILRDIAAPLGGEFAFAVDGPLLPVPSWKVIFEVHDPAQLNTTFERLVARLNVIAREHGKRGFVFERETAAEQTFYSITSLDLGLSVHFTYADNYLVMTQTRALLDRTLRFRDAGMTLRRAPRFTASLPTDADANFSAVFYQNLGGVLSPVARTMRGLGVGDEMEKNSEAGGALRTIEAFAPPALAYARAASDSITISAPTKGGPFGITPSTFLGLPGEGSLGSVLGQGISGAVNEE